MIQTGSFSDFEFKVLNFFDGKHAGAENCEYSICVTVLSIEMSFIVRDLSQAFMVIQPIEFIPRNFLKLSVLMKSFLDAR